MMKGRYPDAFRSLRRLRHTELQAARDLYCASRTERLVENTCSRTLTPADIHVLLELEKEASTKTSNKFLELFTVPRNRRATLASSIVMFM